MLEYMAPLMFAGLVVFLLLGYPVAFSLAFTGLAFALLGIELGMLQPALLQALPERVLGIMANSTLLAIPFFTFMGLILERSGMAEELLDTIGQVFGSIRGGVAYAVVFVGALLAATTGVVAASVLAMGLISLPVMMRYGYSNRLSTGVIAASGTLAQIIPPSLVLIVLADQMGASVGDMYEGALIPGLGLAALYAVWVFVVSIVKPEAAPACPPEARTLHGAKLLGRVFTSMIPPLVLIFLVLGTIFIGVATPTEGGAMGATGALIMALVKRKLSWRLLKQAVESTATMTSFVMFILVGSTVFSLVFRGVNGDLWVESLLTARAGRRARLPDRRERDDLPARVLPRLFRDRLHHGAAAHAGGAEARHRPDLVRRAAGGQHADLVPAPAFRLRAVLPAQRGAEERQDLRHLLGRDSVRLHPGPDGGDRHRLPEHRDRATSPQAAGAIKGTGADELQRQIRRPSAVTPDSGKAPASHDQKSDDATLRDRAGAKRAEMTLARHARYLTGLL